MKTQHNENPRWTLCREAFGFEPQAWEFSLWVMARWREYAQVLGVDWGYKGPERGGYDSPRDAIDMAREIGSPDTVDDDFDAWLAAWVEQFKRELPLAEEINAEVIREED